MTNETPASEADEGPCTDCWDTGINQNERRCVCQPPAQPPLAGDEVERVALAIAKVVEGQNFDPFSDPEAFDFAQAMAQAAIAAMRPTEADYVSKATAWDAATSIPPKTKVQLADLTRELAKANREVLDLITGIWESEFREEAPDFHPSPELQETLDRIGARVDHWQEEKRQEKLALAWCRANGNPHITNSQ